jgi:hypothetical protein
MRVHCVVLLLASGFLLSSCASINEVENYSGKLEPGDGVLVIAVNSDVWFQDLRFIRPHDAFAAIAARNLPKGRSLHFVELPAGDYQWVKIDLSDNTYEHRWVALDDDKKQRFTFTVKPGVMNYPGDFVVATANNGYNTRYYIQLIDRSAMLLSDLGPDQKTMLDNLGWVYSGPGTDDFPAYLKSLKAKVKQP